MHINKVTDSSSTDLFFEIMSKFNDDIEKIKREELDRTADFTKEASAAASGFKQFNKFTQIGADAAAAGGKSLPKLLKALQKGTQPVNFTRTKFYGIKNLIEPIDGKFSPTIQRISQEMGAEFDMKPHSIS